MLVQVYDDQKRIWERYYVKATGSLLLRALFMTPEIAEPSDKYFKRYARNSKRRWKRYDAKQAALKIAKAATKKEKV